jgi:serine protease AprX
MKRASILTLVLTALIFGFAQTVPAQRVASGGERNAETAVWGSRVARPIAETGESSTVGQPSDRQVSDKSDTCKHPAAKLSPDLPTTGKVNIIVMYFAPPQKDDDDDVANQGGTLKNKFNHVKASAVTVNANKIAKIASRCNVKYIALDRKVKRHDYTGNVASGTLGANYAWQSGYTGTGVGVAIVDSGIYNHPDLQTSNGSASRIVYSEDFTGSGSANDQYGHGTHVAGIVGGNGASSTGSGFTKTFSGMAPNVNLINLRVLDANGSGTDSVVIAAIEQAIALQSTYNIRVLNLSLGRAVQESYQFDPLCQAAEAAWQAGIVVVTAAGNAGRDNSLKSHGYGMIISPGNDPYVITVGAMKAMGTAAPYDDQIASFSSKGPTLFDHIVKPDMVAPGNQIPSLLAPGATLPTTYPALIVPPGQYMSHGGGQTSAYLSLSGTSMSTPFVSGAAALLIQKDPTLTPDQVKARLMKTADKMAAGFDTYMDPPSRITYKHQYDIFTVGSGYLDLASAINNTDRPSSTSAALSPYVTFNSTTGTLKVRYDNAFYGGQTVIWGDTLVWGTTLVWGSSVLNAADDGSGDFSLIWGSSTIFASDDDTGGFSLIWGSTVIWGDTVIWGESDYSDDPEAN